MLSSIARLASRRPRLLGLVAVLALILFGLYGGPVTGLLNAANSFEAPASRSAHELKLIQQATHAEPTPGIIALVPAGPSSPEVVRVAARIRAVPGVAQVSWPPSNGPSGLVSRDGGKSLVAVSLTAAAAGAGSDKVVDAITAVLPRGVLLGGSDTATAQVNSQASDDLGFAELLAFPLLALIGYAIFRGIVALLPVAVGGISVLGAFSLLRLINDFVALSNFALNLVIGLGLGLAVDYSLLLVWRFREELSRGAEPPEALALTMATAGRTVAFSGVTVAAAMLTLLVFPQRFLVSMGIGGAAVALMAAACALGLAPGLLILLAGRIGRVDPGADGTGRWYRLAHAVMRRPVLVAAAATACLLLIAAPTLGVRWSGIDATVLPTSQSARIVQDTMTREFAAQDLDPVTIAIQAPGGRERARLRVGLFAQELRLLRGIEAVAPPVSISPGVWKLDVSAAGDPIAAQAQETIAAVDALAAAQPGLSVDVGGVAAEFRDQRAAITGGLPLALGLLVLVTLVILWLMTGSVVLPIKALVMNALTTFAATGALVFIFQDGRLTGLLDYTSQGGIEQTDFIILVAVAFALSTDYGVLLLTRIKEARDGGHANREAVALGIQRTGRIVTASAILVAVAIGAFATSHIVFLKELGIGAVIAILADAFIVRTALVPALMVMLDELNWWQPAPLRWLHERIAFTENGPVPETVQ
jgi:uncharacterized membrane protein YdfJ with MMPL/SSD domain